MTAPIIPADQWPGNAGGHVWDETGRGNWMQYRLGVWFLWASDVPMPAGHDWRVPVLRPDTGNPVSATAIDLGAYAVAIQYAINGLREAGGKTDNVVAQKLDRLLTLIDGQAAPRPLIARQLAEWHDDDGPVMWWAWCGHGWAGEPGWCGTPNDSDWPGYHTHWTPHPPVPVQPTKGEGER